MTVLLTAGCYNDFDYEYVSLAASMEILEYGQTDLDNVRNHTDIPIRYQLEREQYTLFASVDKLSIPPAVIFTIEGKSLIDANIKGESLKCIAVFQPIRPSEARRHGYPEDGIRFSWKPNNIPPCDNVKLPMGDDRKVVISVYGGTGYLVAEEEILFEIRTSGTRREINSI